MTCKDVTLQVTATACAVMHAQLWSKLLYVQVPKYHFTHVCWQQLLNACTPPHIAALLGHQLGDVLQGGLCQQRFACDTYINHIRH